MTQPTDEQIGHINHKFKKGYDVSANDIKDTISALTELISLRKQVEELQERLRWRKYLKESPKKPDWYLVKIGRYRRIRECWFTGEVFLDIFTDEMERVYWLPIPLPEEE